jgi:hypothetical protein
MRAECEARCRLEWGVMRPESLRASTTSELNHKLNEFTEFKGFEEFEFREPGSAKFFTRNTSPLCGLRSHEAPGSC